MAGVTVREQEDAQGYVHTVRTVVVAQGVPLALDAHRHEIFVTIRKSESRLEEQLAGRRPLTQMGRLLEELQVELILARSPQGPGAHRAPRGHLPGPPRERAAAALAATVAAANVVLAEHLARHNRQFAVVAPNPEPAERPGPRDLDVLFCFKFHGVVALDHTVQFASQRIDSPSPGFRSLARTRVEVRQRFDGTRRLFHEGHCLASAPAALASGPPPYQPCLGSDRRRARPPHPVPGKPASTHPWRPPGPGLSDKVRELLRGHGP